MKLLVNKMPTLRYNCMSIVIIQNVIIPTYKVFMKIIILSEWMTHLPNMQPTEKRTMLRFNCAFEGASAKMMSFSLISISFIVRFSFNYLILRRVKIILYTGINTPERQFPVIILRREKISNQTD
jgi:hypothetical protein